MSSMHGAHELYAHWWLAPYALRDLLVPSLCISQSCGCLRSPGRVDILDIGPPIAGRWTCQTSFGAEILPPGGSELAHPGCASVGDVIAVSEGCRHPSVFSSSDSNLSAACQHLGLVDTCPSRAASTRRECLPATSTVRLSYRRTHRMLRLGSGDGSLSLSRRVQYEYACLAVRVLIVHLANWKRTSTNKYFKRRFFDGTITIMMICPRRTIA